MNKELLLKVKTKILEHPERFDMFDWTKEKSCGTAHCIAGWIGAVSGESDVMGDRASELLGIKRCVGERLFFTDRWPEIFRIAYDAPRYDDGYLRPDEEVDWKAIAQIAADRIDHFIATEGAE